VTALGLRGAEALIRPPFAWRTAVLPALAAALRRATVPAIVLVVALAIALPGVQLGDFLANNGQIDRLGAYLTTTSFRWLAPLAAVGALVMAVGGPLTARLARGAAGDRQVSRAPSAHAGELVAAHAIAFGAAATVLALLILPASVGAGAAVATVVFDVPAGVVVASLFDAARFGDLVPGIMSAFVSGALAALVCCYYGLAAVGAGQGPKDRGGGIDGRAVRDALVAALMVVAFVNVVLAAYLLAAFPDLRFTR